ncbi:MAG: hypothetical protein COV74_02150 [Candidatus Omnitrophica bacterium CG11_big_fil_rev_8_21_14_0_20_45_26]|uniref:Uncharacterized protein n=1 Tax=Candidatus Abzuiibacterium crystallinum TaxID=1974748 RepID=A0A2H0LRW2_9BACT|nr:MAG: hypothetical protein COV74_02150 [Candidatus Omnitrophica bacterium CG11_big_fil_rev_8_21_14_0_20_45_26]PIW64883.1 MAG: hypothetical protein COW12_04390 [Candidatus Omnitrophica bacterium CG12_big_fil_rev_8_21_14_0_65_45_16]
MKKLTGIKHYLFWMALVSITGSGVITTVSCAGRTSTSMTTTQTTQGELGSSRSVTTEKEVVTDAHPRGVIGGIFYTIGQVILFPFKLIGSLFS